MFDGRYVYFAPYYNGSEVHGEVLRLDTQTAFDEASSWVVFDPGDQGLGDDPDGYTGAIFDGRYVYFVPFNNGSGRQSQVLRFDTFGNFVDIGSWSTFDPEFSGGYIGGVFDGRHVYFAPYSVDGAHHGEVLRFDTESAFDEASSWAVFDAGLHGVGDDPSGYTDAVFDGRYVYFAPSYNDSFGRHGEVLRYDTTAAFDEAPSWATFDAGDHGLGNDPDGYRGAIFDGRYVFFVPYANGDTCHGEMLRYDTFGNFSDVSSWAVYDPGDDDVGTDPDGYWGAAFDGTYIYFAPDDNCTEYHGEVLRYDTQAAYSTDCTGEGIPTGNGIPDECEPDCNNNDTADSCDIAWAASPDCNDNWIPDECELEGNDCNENEVPDDCDVDPSDPDGDGEVSPDCNENLTPDECELEGNDCNDNEVPDDCDIADTTSNDCQPDGIPDECQLDDNDCNENEVPDECEPQVVEWRSFKDHGGGAGHLGITLDGDADCGDATVETRWDGITEVAVEFTHPIAVPLTTNIVMEGLLSGPYNPDSVSLDGDVLTMMFSGTANADYYTITLGGIVGTQWGELLGDVDVTVISQYGNVRNAGASFGWTDAIDVNRILAMYSGGVLVTEANCMYDIDSTGGSAGVIDASDASHALSTFSQLPDCP